MAKYLDKWKDLFPDTVGGTTRPSEAVSDQEEFNTDGFPQFIAQDPVNYALQNAFLKQFLSNDAWLWVKQKQANQALDDHKVDTQAHAKGISGNAGSATKLANARTINLSGAVTADAASFDGTADVTINVKTLDASKLKGTTSVSTTGNAAAATTVNATAPNGGAADLVFGTMATNDYARIRVYGKDDNGALEIATADAGDEPIYVRQYDGAYDWPNGRPGTVVNEAAILDSNGNTKFPKNVTAASFTGPLNGNAATADRATTANSLNEISDRPASANVTYNDGKIRYFLATSSMKEGKPSGGDGPVMHLSGDIPSWESQITVNNPSGHIQTRTQDNGTWGSWKTVLDSKNYNNFAPTKTGAGASGTWDITATNADTVDGYHASDLFRHLGGNQTPVITDIFDRAGTIDMTTMSDADKATHKANINKAANAVQNIWNTDTGIRAYGGDYDMANGYVGGTIKLTQSYKNFDKILVVCADDKGVITYTTEWDVWELSYMLTNYCAVLLANGDSEYWTIWGTAKHGNATEKWSTDTILSCRDQNSGIVAIYGIKY